MGDLSCCSVGSVPHKVIKLLLLLGVISIGVNYGAILVLSILRIVGVTPKLPSRVAVWVTAYLINLPGIWGKVLILPLIVLLIFSALYVVFSTLRKTVDGRNIFFESQVFSIVTLGLYILSELVAGIPIVVDLNSHLKNVSALMIHIPFQLVSVIFLLVAILQHYRDLDNEQANESGKNLSGLDYWMVRIFFQNALAATTAWFFAHAVEGLIVGGSATPQFTLMKMLGWSVYLLILVFYALLDVWKFDAYTRFLFAPYLVFPLLTSSRAMHAVLFTQNKDLKQRIFFLVFGAVCCALLVLKLVNLLVRSLFDCKTGASNDEEKQQLTSSE